MDYCYVKDGDTGVPVDRLVLDGGRSTGLLLQSAEEAAVDKWLPMPLTLEDSYRQILSMEVPDDMFRVSASNGPLDSIVLDETPMNLRFDVHEDPRIQTGTFTFDVGALVGLHQFYPGVVRFLDELVKTAGVNCDLDLKFIGDMFEAISHISMDSVEPGHSLGTVLLDYYVTPRIVRLDFKVPSIEPGKQKNNYELVEGQDFNCATVDSNGHVISLVKTTFDNPVKQCLGCGDVSVEGELSWTSVANAGQYLIGFPRSNQVAGLPQFATPSNIYLPESSSGCCAECGPRFKEAAFDGKKGFALSSPVQFGFYIATQLDFRGSGKFQAGPYAHYMGDVVSRFLRDEIGKNDVVDRINDELVPLYGLAFGSDPEEDFLKDCHIAQRRFVVDYK